MLTVLLGQIDSVHRRRFGDWQLHQSAHLAGHCGISILTEFGAQLHVLAQIPRDYTPSKKYIGVNHS